MKNFILGVLLALIAFACFYLYQLDQQQKDAVSVAVADDELVVEEYFENEEEDIEEVEVTKEKQRTEKKEVVVKKNKANTTEKEATVAEEAVTRKVEAKNVESGIESNTEERAVFVDNDEVTVSKKANTNDVNDDKHLKFKGVAINGTLEQYVAKMRQQGFSKISMSNGSAKLRGDFAGYKDCILYVQTLDNKDLVSRIQVDFQEREVWSELYGNYTTLKDLLTKKYGKPSKSVERFDDRYVDDDESRMYNVKFDRCKYKSTFRTDNGEIILWINHIGVSECFVSLQYTDKINSKVIENAALGDL